ncbi:Carbohydrate esterase family 12 protein [Mycena sanguinolenta]|uniref:Carbohydrate esterase family 12 protein n=1 Tax=Mycena sanguinolenta TaxID=230812 RepID=A0A8H6XF76_9AGAR|nr:Carbohydrate esterase family 12 protein [Mycena sanguinolenta]
MMRSVLSTSLLFLSLVSAQTLHLAGDSTMAVGGGGSGTRWLIGWGVPLPQFLTIPVVNHAVAGESARSYTNDGGFANVIAAVKSGDFVIIEFGHNDVSAGAVDNGQQDAVGDGYNITEVVTTANGTQITIHSFAFYVENAVNSIKAKGGIPIISSLTPDNIWSGTTIAAGGRFVGYAQSVGTDTSITYVDHFDYVAQAYDNLGETTVNTFYPIDHLHTNAGRGSCGGRGLPEGTAVWDEFFEELRQCSWKSGTERLLVKCLVLVVCTRAHVILCRTNVAVRRASYFGHIARR